MNGMIYQPRGEVGIIRVTKLHILFVLLVLGIGLYGHYFFRVKQVELRETEKRVQAEMAALKIAQDEFAKKLSEKQILDTPPAIIEETVVDPVETITPVTPPHVVGIAGSVRESRSYTVQSGDTLWSIAKMPQHFGQGHRWYDIWKANEDIIYDFDSIMPGEVITIPLDKPDNHPWPLTTEQRRRQLLGENNLSTY